MKNNDKHKKILINVMKKRDKARIINGTNIFAVIRHKITKYHENSQKPLEVREN